MLDIKAIRQNPQVLIDGMAKRGKDVDLDTFLELDAKRRALIADTELLKGRRNEASAQVARMRKQGENTDALQDEMKQVGLDIKALDEQIATIEQDLEYRLLTIPNIPHESVPSGTSDTDNVEMRRYGQPREFDFEPKPHWEIGEALGILDFASAAKVTGSRFTFCKGLGARLERSLISFFLDTHVKAGYTEVLPPYMVHRRSMQGTGQLPKFEEDAFKVTGTEYFLIPTAEVPVTNIHRDEIINVEDLPIRYTAYSACFRAEAGSAGRDTRGIIRQHQFNKVELVEFVKPQDSYAALESLTAEAEHVLQLLGLPYRVSLLCGGDLGFSSAKTYDIEVWMPSYNRYVEISSCSNFEDFQARRASIRYREVAGEKAQFLHTLNGSGVAVGRTVAAILENMQQADGTVIVPEVLRPYMGVEKID